jgi:hypothetical protein
MKGNLFLIRCLIVAAAAAAVVLIGGCSEADILRFVTPFLL